MARNLSPSGLAFPVTRSAPPPALLCDSRILGREGVPLRAVRLSAFPGAIRGATQSKPCKVVSLLRSQKFNKSSDASRVAIIDRIGLEPAAARKISQKVSHAFDGNALSDAPVTLTLGSSDPATIQGLIVPVVVDAVDEVSGGPVAHVGNERAEIAQPSVTHSDAATAVVLELRKSRVVATAKHALPDGVQGMGVLERHSCVPFSEHTITKWMGKAK